MPSSQHDEAVAAVGRLLQVVGADAPVERRRAAWGERYGTLPLAPGTACTTAPVPGVDAEWLGAADAGPAVVQYHHGGGYSAGSLNTHRQLASRLAAASNGRVLNVGYRLAPEHPYPAAMDDAVACYRWLLDQGVSESTIVLGGDSAGGGLAAGLTHAIAAAGLPRPAGLLMLAPQLDLRPKPADTTDMFVSAARSVSLAGIYLGDHDPADPLVSPIAGAVDEFPPVYLQVSSSEALYDDSAGMADLLRVAGVDVTLDVEDGLMHTWQFLAPDAPETKSAIERLGRFVARCTAAS